MEGSALPPESAAEGFRNLADLSQLFLGNFGAKEDVLMDGACEEARLLVQHREVGALISSIVVVYVVPVKCDLALERIKPL